MKEKNKQKETPFLCYARCFTFNHAPYIVATMNGFTMQQTNFTFACIIVDDASTDGEPDVIRKYLQEHFDLEDKSIVKNEETDDFVMTYARHKENLNCYFAVYFLKYNHYSINKNKFPYFADFIEHTKYEAICEGDDYWIDPLKLQKQVDILEKSPEVSLVHTSFNTIDERGNIISRPKYNGYIKKSHSGNILPTLFYYNYILTLTMMVRIDVFRHTLFIKCPRKYDYAIAFSAAFLGKCAFIEDKSGCYRKTSGSQVTANAKNLEKGLFIVYEYFVNEVLKDTYCIHCSFLDKLKMYRNIYVNLFYHNNYPLIRKLLKKNAFTFLLIPEAFVFSVLKMIKRRTFGSIDR